MCWQAAQYYQSTQNIMFHCCRVWGSRHRAAEQLQRALRPARALRQLRCTFNMHCWCVLQLTLCISTWGQLPLVQLPSTQPSPLSHSIAHICCAQCSEVFLFGTAECLAIIKMIREASAARMQILQVITQGEWHCACLQDHEALPLCMTATLSVEEAVMLTDQDALYCLLEYPLRTVCPGSRLYHL